jgi:hypothetical protein
MGVSADHCVHYNGIIPRNKTCGAGVEYMAVAAPLSGADRRAAGGNPRFGVVHRIPCIRTNRVDTCNECRFPTPAEHAAAVEQSERSAGRAMALLAAVLEDGRESGNLPCPTCGIGTVTFAGVGTRAVRIACSTQGCVQMVG